MRRLPGSERWTNDGARPGTRPGPCWSQAEPSWGLDVATTGVVCGFAIDDWSHTPNYGKRHGLSRLYINGSLMHRRNKGHDWQAQLYKTDGESRATHCTLCPKDCVSMPTWAVATAGVSSAEAIGHLSHQLAHGRH